MIIVSSRSIIRRSSRRCRNLNLEEGNKDNLDLTEVEFKDEVNETKKFVKYYLRQGTL